ncbi:MAG: HEAT repeat domain-containing protein [Gemmatimonadota bacterium]
MNGFPLFGLDQDVFLGLLVDVTVRGSLLLLLIAGLTRLLRDRSAAVRHAAWTAGIVAFLALPLLSTNLPWRLKVLPLTAGAPAAQGAQPALDAAPPAVQTTGDARPELARDARSEVDPGAMAGAAAAGSGDRLQAERATEDGVAAEPVGAVAGARSALAALGLKRALLLLWATGTLLLVARLLIGSVRVRRLVSRARELTDEPSERSVFHLARRLGIGSYVRLVHSDEISMPITTGVGRPTIVLPDGFEDWSEDRLRAVILHELAHIQRRDVLSHLMSRFACALHWFNPMAWHSAARLRTESERACDDMVLGAGTRASAYADHLLSILRACSTVPSPATAIPMARRTEFEGRLLAILEPDARRAAAGRGTIVTLAALVALVAVPLAALAPSEAEAPAIIGAPASTDAQPDGFPEVERAELDAAPVELEEEERAVDTVERTLTDAVEGAADRIEHLGGGASELGNDLANIARGAVDAIDDIQDTFDQEVSGGRLVAALTPILTDDEDPRTRTAAALALGDVEDPRAVEALSRALAEDPDEDVRRAAAWALGEIESPLGVPALARAARTDASMSVREMAVWALGEIEHPDAIPALAEIATSAGPDDIRRRAVWGLGEIEHPDAIPTLADIATSDAPEELRRLAVWGLGEIEHPDAIPALGRVIRDEQDELRAMAVWALGEIEHPDGVEYLRAPLSDPDPAMRRRAVWALGEIESERGVDVVAEALSDSDASVRATAVWALGEIESGRAVPHLTPLLRDADNAVRLRAAWALGEIESGAAVEALSAAAVDTDLRVRQVVVWALAEIESPRGVPALRRALADDDRQVRFMALRGLADIETPDAMEGIIDALESGDADMRRAATAALGGGNGYDWDDSYFDFDWDDVFGDLMDWDHWDDDWYSWSDDPDPDPDPDF